MAKKCMVEVVKKYGKEITFFKFCFNLLRFTSRKLSLIMPSMLNIFFQIATVSSNVIVLLMYDLNVNLTDGKKIGTTMSTKVL